MGRVSCYIARCWGRSGQSDMLFGVGREEKRGGDSLYGLGDKMYSSRVHRLDNWLVSVLLR